MQETGPCEIQWEREVQEAEVYGKSPLQPLLLRLCFRVGEVEVCNTRSIRLTASQDESFS